MPERHKHGVDGDGNSATRVSIVHRAKRSGMEIKILNWTLIVVVAILLLSMAYGYRRGLIRMVFTSVLLVLTLVLTRLASPYVTEIVQNYTGLYDTVYTQMEGYLDKQVQKAAEESGVPLPDGVSADQVLDQMTSGQQSQLIQRLPLPENLRQSLQENNNSEIYKLIGAAGFTSYLAAYLSRLILNAVCSLLTFLFVSLVLRLLAVALDIISHLPVIHTLNKVGGMLVSLLLGLAIVWVGFLAATALSGTVFGQEVLRSISENAFLSLLYQHNLLLQAVSGVGALLMNA